MRNILKDIQFYIVVGICLIYLFVAEKLGIIKPEDNETNDQEWEQYYKELR